MDNNMKEQGTQATYIKIDVWFVKSAPEKQSEKYVEG
jgi:hypothetical protein